MSYKVKFKYHENLDDFLQGYNKYFPYLTSSAIFDLSVVQKHERKEKKKHLL